MTSTGSESANTYSPESIITLNVGGKIFQTTLQTLTTPISYYDNAEEDEIGKDFSKEEQEHLLRTMFLNNEFNLQRDKDGNVFIDRDPDVFKYILEFLRCEGMVSLFHFPPKLAGNIATEAQYFGLVKLEELASGAYPLPPSASSYFTRSFKLQLPKPFQNSQSKLLYLASNDGFSSKVFHEKCDNQGITVIVIFTREFSYLESRSCCTYAGILDGSWSSNNEVLYGRRSMLYYNKEWFCKKRSTAAAFCHAEYGPIFGSSLEDFDIKVDGSMQQLQVNLNDNHYYRSHSASGIQTYEIRDIEVHALYN